MLVPVLFVHCSWRFNSGADGEGEILPSAYTLLPGNYDAGDDAKSDQKKPQVDEKAYKSALERIPEPKEKYDPWGVARPADPIKQKQK